MKKILVALLPALAALAATVRAAEPPSEADLARQLHREGQYAASAIEFRRLALDAEPPLDAAGWYWMAARAYARPDDVHAARLALKMLDRAEDAAPADALATPLSFLRAELSLRLGDFPSARYYFESIAYAADAALPDDPDAAAWYEFAARGAAAADLFDGDLAAARDAIAEFPSAVAAVDGYAARSRKSPTLGGFLGLVPGLGYLYSGEYANALRSVLLNGLFIWAMVETASDDDWGLFAVCAFMETTWYSGSIYGGIDAAQRHNKKALDDAIADLRPVPPSAVVPDETVLPLIRLRFQM